MLIRPRAEIFFANEPFSSSIGDTQPILCQPVIFRLDLGSTGFAVHIGLLREDGWAQTMSCSHFLGNVFDAYRATGFLRRYSQINERDLATTYRAGSRSGTAADDQRSVIAVIGKDAFAGIMSLDIPAELVKKVAQLPYPCPRVDEYVAAEIAAGTIADDDFSKFTQG